MATEPTRRTLVLGSFLAEGQEKPTEQAEAFARSYCSILYATSPSFDAQDMPYMVIVLENAAAQKVARLLPPQKDHATLRAENPPPPDFHAHAWQFSTRQDADHVFSFVVSVGKTTCWLIKRLNRD